MGLSHMKTPVSLWTLVAKTDVPYMLQTIPHQIRSCNYPFVEKVLAIDTAPLTGDKLHRYDTGSQKELEKACQTLIDRGVCDRIVTIDYSPELVQKIYSKYFGAAQAAQMLEHTHNWKGSTIYASLYCIEASKTDYYLHFDADMLLYQHRDFDWIGRAIAMIDSVPEIAAIRPFCGPPDPQGKLDRRRRSILDDRGFFAHKGFSMRVYLVNRNRFAELAPIPLMWKYKPLLSKHLPSILQPWSAKIECRLKGEKAPIKGALASFEPMTSNRLADTHYVRADLADSRVWTIHPAKHGADFIEALPDLISLIERGKYPPAQVNHYDLCIR
jgi:hypothetical protein